MERNIGAAKVLAKLPDGDWRLASFGDAIIAICPDHAPRVIRGDTVEVLDLGAPMRLVTRPPKAD